MIDRITNTIRPALIRSKFDPDKLAKRLGYQLSRHDGPFPGNSPARVIKRLACSEIQLVKGAKKVSELESILHEDLHNHFHSECISYRLQHDLMDSIEEGQAEMYAGVALMPALDGFYTEDEFLMSCGLSASVALMRLQFYKKNGW